MTKKNSVTLTEPEIWAFYKGFKTRLVKPFLRGTKVLTTIQVNAVAPSVERLKGPYGVPGDRLWVKESSVGCGEHKINGVVCEGEFPGREHLCSGCHGVRYKADGAYPVNQVWASSAQMQESSSRFALELVSVTLQRLHTIKESTVRDMGLLILPGENLLSGFEEHWRQERHKKGLTWEDNPWVWNLKVKFLQRSRLS